MKLLYNLLFCIGLVSCGSNADTLKEYRIQGNAFGTTYTIINFSKKNQTQIKRGVDSIVNAVNHSMSTYITDSDISKINRGDTTVVVDAMFKEVFLLSRKLNQATLGYFDPTVGVLRNAYGFGDVRPQEKIDKPLLDSLMTSVGWSKVRLNDNGTITKENANIYFDFNAIAKGYGIDRIAVYLESLGVYNFLVELGGEVVSRGVHKLKNKPWLLGVEAIESAITARAYEAKLHLANRAMAASGNYRKNRIDKATGQEYVHTINPILGTAKRSDVLSATVLAPTCAEADAWATSCMAMGLAMSKKILENYPDIDVYLRHSNGVYISEGFKNTLVK